MEVVKMINTETIITVTKKALVLRIPWETVAQHLRPKPHKTSLTVEDVLRLVEEGRQAHRHGKARIIHSLSELQS